MHALLRFLRIPVTRRAIRLGGTVILMDSPDWRLREQMLRAGITSAAELHRRLVDAYGTTISAAQISRLVSGPPERLNLQLLAEICDLLHCSLADVLIIRRDFPNDEPVLAENLADKHLGLGTAEAAVMAARRVERSGSYTDLEKSLAWSLAAISDGLSSVTAAIERVSGDLADLAELSAASSSAGRE